MLRSKTVTVILIEFCRRIDTLGHIILLRKQPFSKATVMSSHPDYKFNGKEASDSSDKSENSKQRVSFADALRQSIKLPLKEGSNPVCATVLHPGLLPEAVGPNGQTSLTSLLKMASTARIYAMHMPMDDEGHTFLEYNKMTAECMTFFASTQLNIQPSMYDITVSKQPLEVKVEPGHIGRSSLSTVTTVMTPDQLTLMTQISQVVMVDRATRRPIPIKEEWRDKYQAHCVRGEPLVVKEQPPPPTGPLSIYEVRVAWSDTDLYKHTNFSSYARFALDAVHHALRLGKLGKRLTTDHFAAGLSQVRVAYLGECVEGELLTVQVWPGEGDRCVVCSMEKGEGEGERRLVNQVTLTFCQL